MAERIADVGNNLALFKVNVDEIKEQDVNARVMPPEMFERLTDTIKKEGRLESLPLCVSRGKKFELMSGHHRLRAARQAGLNDIYVLVDTRELKRSQVVAKQLAHNRISGEDDKQTLAKLYAELDTVDALLESYVTPEDFDTIQQLEPATITDISLEIEWKQLSLVFLSHAFKRFDKLDEFARKIPREADAVGVVNMELFERFRTAVLGVGKVENVRSLGAIMTRLVELAEAHISERASKTDKAA